MSSFLINATFKDQVFFRSRSLFNIKVHFLDFGLTIYFLRDNHTHFFTKNQDKGNHSHTHTLYNSPTLYNQVYNYFIKRL